MHASVWTVFGHAPVLGLLGLLFIAGRARGWALRPALLATAALVAGMPLGVAMLPSVLGAVAGGVATWLLAQRMLGLRRPPLAALAIGLVCVLAIGRCGCWLAGCCFGRVADLAWAVRYDQGSATWLLHHTLGWIASDAPTSLPVHPYPLYESAGLVAGLPVLLRLRRRLRSEGALLLFAASYDLALRGIIDGTRAMVNVWWALVDAPWGLNLFQWALIAMALVCLGAGLVLERRARRSTEPCPGRTDEPAPQRLWVVFVGLWAIGWLGDGGQTLFLHRILVAALVLAALALRLPTCLSARGWLRIAGAPALGAGLALVLGAHVEHTAQADAGAALVSARGWLYEVDHQRAVLVRVGSQQESPASVQQRRATLDLPATSPSSEPASPPVAPPPAATGRTWVGGGVMGGAASYRVQNACSSNYVAYDRKLGGGWLQAEREVPATPTSVWWLGGRAVAVFESQKKTTHPGTAGDQVDQYSMQGYDGQVWAEWEHPNFSFGFGAMLGLQNRSRTGGTSVDDNNGSTSSLTGVFRPSGHLRAGFSFLGVDVGAYDRASFVGRASAHIGVSGSIGRGFVRVRHPDDTAVKYFVGAVLLPGADSDLNLFQLGLGLEAFLSRRLVLGAQGGIGDGGFLAGYVRAAFGQ